MHKVYILSFFILKWILFYYKHIERLVMKRIKPGYTVYIFWEVDFKMLTFFNNFIYFFYFFEIDTL